MNSVRVWKINGKNGTERNLNIPIKDSVHIGCRRDWPGIETDPTRRETSD
jgi:hypothetical protein